MNYIFLFFCSIILPIISVKHVRPKLCINCKFFIPDQGDGKYGKCSLFQKSTGKIDFLVNGITNNEYFYCSSSREINSMCGEEGKYYKKKRTRINRNNSM
jgi:hypothetical protein